MNLNDKLAFLIEYLQKESSQYQDSLDYQDFDACFRVFRSLCNIREPKPISPEFLKIQDEFLTEYLEMRGVFDAKKLKSSLKDSRLFVWQGDITTLKCDAIVNAANNKLLGCWLPNHNCIDNFIHTFAGVQLRRDCNEIMLKQGHLEETGIAKITGGYNLPCKYVIHTVGPIIENEVQPYQKIQLANCYKNSLEIANMNNCESIAFCCISTGVFNYPQQEAAELAIQTVLAELPKYPNIQQVIFNVFKDKDLEIYNSLLN